jgi:hypothetical protein
MISLALLGQTFAQMRQSRNADDGIQPKSVRRRELTVGSSATCARRGSLLVAHTGDNGRRPARPVTGGHLPRRSDGAGEHRRLAAPTVGMALAAEGARAGFLPAGLPELG